MEHTVLLVFLVLGTLLAAAVGLFIFKGPTGYMNGEPAEAGRGKRIAVVVGGLLIGGAALGTAFSGDLRLIMGISGFVSLTYPMIVSWKISQAGTPQPSHRRDSPATLMVAGLIVLFIIFAAFMGW